MIMSSMRKRVLQRKHAKKRKRDPRSSLPDSVPERSIPESGVLILGPKLGRGSYGSVVKGTFHTPDDIVTGYKGFPLDSHTTYGIKYQDKRETEHEVMILRMLGHESEYIVTFYGTATPPDSNENSLLMVVEKLDTTLFQHFTYSIQRRRAGFVRTAFQMFEAIAFLESKQVVHLDLHGGNIMFRGDDPVLIDFGLAEQTRGGSITPFSNRRLTRWRHWHPPEQRIWDGTACKYAPITTRFDVFSIAVNLLNLIYDPGQNEGGLRTNEFHILLTRALLQTNESDFRFVTLDKRLKEGFETGTGSSVETVPTSTGLSQIYTRFRRAGEHPILQLHMPGKLAELFKRCLFYERWRPLASKIVEDLDGIYPSASSQFHDVFSDDDYLQDMTLRF